MFTLHTAPSVRPAAGSRSCGGERSHSGSGRRAAGACSVRVARAGRTQGEIEGTSGALFLERERRGRAGARGEHRGDRGGDMRTYWLHSVWVLGFFLSLFSLQGKEKGCPRPLAPPPSRRRARGWVGGQWNKERSECGRNEVYLQVLRCAPCPRAGVCGQTCCISPADGEIWNRCVCVCVGGGGGCCEWRRRSWGCSSVNSSSATAVFAVPASPVLIPLHSSSFQEGIGIKFRRKLGMHLAPGTCTSVQNNPYRFDSTVGEGIGWRGEGDGGGRARKRMNSWVNSCTDSKWSIRFLVGGLNS